MSAQVVTRLVDDSRPCHKGLYDKVGCYQLAVQLRSNPISDEYQDGFGEDGILGNEGNL